MGKSFSIIFWAPLEGEWAKILVDPGVGELSDICPQWVHNGLMGPVPGAIEVAGPPCSVPRPDDQNGNVCLAPLPPSAVTKAASPPLEDKKEAEQEEPGEWYRYIKIGYSRFIVNL